MNITLLLAQSGAKSEINQWLNEHPLILGLIFLAIGGVLLGTGIYGLRSGVTHDKHGNEMSGGLGMMMSVVRIIGGVGCCGFAIYKMLLG